MASRCGRRLFLQAAISASTSASVRYSRVRTVSLRGRRQLMRQIMHYDGEFRREEAISAVGSSAKTDALARSADSGSGRLEHGDQFDPTPRWTGLGSFGRARFKNLRTIRD